MPGHYETIRKAIESLNLNTNQTFEILFETDSSDARLNAINALLNTESIFLAKITAFLTESFTLLHKFVNKKQFTNLFRHFPTIYSLHIDLNQKVRDELESSMLIGKVLFEFLGRGDVLEVYEGYVQNILNVLSICKSVEKKASEKFESLRGLEHVVMSPMVWILQLSENIGDVFENTSYNHVDKVDLFKALSMAKYIVSRLDRKRRNYEYNDFEDVKTTLKKLGFICNSSSVLSTQTVFVTKPKHSDPQKVVRIPYFVMLCDQDVILLKKEVPLRVLSTESVFCSSLSAADIEQTTLVRFLDWVGENKVLERIDSAEDFERVQKICLVLKGGSMDEALLTKYTQMLHDQSVLKRASSSMRSLNFEYDIVDVSTIDKALLNLERNMKESEKELNSFFSPIVSLKNTSSKNSKTSQMMTFKSPNASNDWKVGFNRAKVFSTFNKEIDWTTQDSKDEFQRLGVSELPMVFEPFLLKDMWLVDIEVGPAKYHSVTVVVKSKMYSCLWVCLPKGLVIILHFDYKRWRIFESFTTLAKETVTDICSSKEKHYGSQQMIDSEVWMASGRNVYVHSVTKNENSTLQNQFNFATTVKCLCNVENDIFVALKSTIIIYRKMEKRNWCQENTISLHQFLGDTDQIVQIQNRRKIVYVVCENKIILYEKNEERFFPKKKFDSNHRISAVSISNDGVWVSFKAQNFVTLYDRFFINIFHTIALPIVETITSLYCTDKFLWIGTESGCVKCVSATDCSFCVDSNVPVYSCSTHASGSITQMIPFRNNQHFIFKKNKENSLDFKVSPIENSNESSAKNIPDKGLGSGSTKEDVDAIGGKHLLTAYKTLKECNLTLMLAFGTGMCTLPKSAQRSEPEFGNDSSLKDYSTIFTFIE